MLSVGPGLIPVADRCIPLVLISSGPHKQVSLPHRGAVMGLIEGPRVRMSHLSQKGHQIAMDVVQTDSGKDVACGENFVLCVNISTCHVYDLETHYIVWSTVHTNI